MSRKSLPAITHLQFLVIGSLLSSERPGREIRKLIAAYGIKRSGPAFYQMMARLERDGLVEGWYEPLVVREQTVKERRYRIRPAGSKAWAAARAFYEAVASAAISQGWSNA